MNNHFWMVYGRGQQGPAWEHPTRERAEAEATRLARQHPDIPFFVLESTARIEKADIRVTRFVGAWDEGQKRYSGWAAEALRSRL